MIIAVLLTTTGSSLAYNYQLSAVEDTFSDTCYLNQNFGDSSKLWAGATVNEESKEIEKSYFTRAYLKFDLSTLSNSVDNAYLWVYAVNSNWDVDFPGLGIGHTNVTVYEEVEPWSESTLTWQNAPDFANNAKGSKVLVDEGAWYSWNVTSFAKNADGGILSLVLASSEPFSIFESSESMDGHTPFLGVNVVPEPLSAGLFLLGGAALVVIRRRKA